MLLKGIILVFVALITQSVNYVTYISSHMIPPVYGNVERVEQNPNEDRNDILFVGDVFLGRAVERHMNEQGVRYPFDGLADFLRNRHTTVGNFESAIPKEHTPTPDLTFQFSTHPRALAAAERAGFDVFSLANNHAYDYGVTGYAHTKAICLKTHVRCIGDPLSVGSHAVYYTVVQNKVIAIIAINAVGADPDADALKTLLASVSKKSDFQIAYVHWGIEYELVHAQYQQYLAHQLIDVGVDTIIGHHPHVVQNIELYNNKPIFYSLGNFIFDQYFADEVQKGLAVVAHIEEELVRFTLHPVSSIENRSQPQLMHGDDKQAFIDVLATLSKPHIATSTITEGIRVSY